MAERGAMTEIVIDDHAALLFDLDGTLVDTMPLHYRCYAEVLAARKLVLSEEAYLAAVGAPAREAIPRFFAAAGAAHPDAQAIAAVHAEKKAALRTLLAGERPVALAAAALLDAARGRVRLGLVSSGNREGVGLLLAAMGWETTFDVVVSGDDLPRGKPHPDPYLHAAATLGVAPPDCLVLEDTVSGIEAARAAGMKVVDVTAPWTFR